MKRFFKVYMCRYWLYYLTGLFFLLITSVITTQIPLYIKQAVDLITQGAPHQALMRVIYSILGMAAVLIVVRSLSRIFLFVPGRKIEFDIRNDLFKHLQQMDAPFYRQHKIGDLMSRLINDLQSLRMMGALAVLHVTNTIMLYTLGIYHMWQIHWKMTLLVLMPIPLVMIIVRVFVKHLYKTINDSQRYLGEFTDYFVDTLGAIRVIKSFVAEPSLYQHFLEKNKAFFKLNLQLAKVRSGMFPFIGIVGSLGHFILFLVGGRLIISGALSVGDFVAMSSYVVLLVWPTASFAWVLNLIQRGRVSWHRIADILDSEPTTQWGELMPQTLPALHLENLSFSYEGQSVPTLQDLSFSILPGQKVGVFGPTGSGKSTLGRLLAGLEQTSKQDYSRDFYLSQVSYVSQNPFLFSLPIEDNILYASTLSESTAQEMAEKACVLDDILQFPSGFNTVVGERGVILSGGQKTRLALARALFKPSSLLILDDVLSAVDHDTEQRLIDMFLTQLRDQSMVVMSHRISALTHMDLILVLDKGKIVDSGTHQALISRPGIYQKTWAYQNSEQ